MQYYLPDVDNNTELSIALSSTPITIPTMNIIPQGDLGITVTPEIVPTQQPINVIVQMPTQEQVLSREQSIQISGQGKCIDCAEYLVSVRLTNYWPNTPPTQSELNSQPGLDIIKTLNCWQYSISSGKCVSNLNSDIPWHGFVGLAAACPYDWPLGSVIDIPSIGRAYICMDRGMMVCHGNPMVCDVDLLLENKPPWDGQVMDAWVKIPWDPGQ